MRHRSKGDDLGPQASGHVGHACEHKTRLAQTIAYGYDRRDQRRIAPRRRQAAVATESRGAMDVVTAARRSISSRQRSAAPDLGSSGPAQNGHPL